MLVVVQKDFYNNPKPTQLANRLLTGVFQFS